MSATFSMSNRLSTASLSETSATNCARIGAITGADDNQVNPDAGDLAVTAGWGHAGQGGVTMPGKGRFVERPYTQTRARRLP